MAVQIPKPPLPSNEAARIEALRQYQILDTPMEQCYDDLAQLASFICACPIAVISLVDQNRQWFKSKVGMTASETERDISFCTHTILELDVMVVKDATADDRFRCSPLVTAEPHICFYAGVPLVNSNGYALGAFCVIDNKPRELSPEQIQALRTLARQAMMLMDYRRASNSLAEALRNLKTLHGLLPICASCKKIRDDEGVWNRIESYISSHSETEFTHGLCPACMERLYPDFAPLKGEQ